MLEEKFLCKLNLATGNRSLLKTRNRTTKKQQVGFRQLKNKARAGRGHATMEQKAGLGHLGTPAAERTA